MEALAHVGLRGPPTLQNTLFFSKESRILDKDETATWDPHPTVTVGCESKLLFAGAHYFRIDSSLGLGVLAAGEI